CGLGVFFQAEDGIRDLHVTGVQTCALPIFYAYLMTQEPVAAEAPGNELSFPFNIRLLLAGWNLLFLDSGAYQPDPSQDEEWNRRSEERRVGKGGRARRSRRQCGHTGAGTAS